MQKPSKEIFPEIHIPKQELDHVLAYLDEVELRFIFTGYVDRFNYLVNNFPKITLTTDPNLYQETVVQTEEYIEGIKDILYMVKKYAKIINLVDGEETEDIGHSPYEDEEIEF